MRFSIATEKHRITNDYLWAEVDTKHLNELNELKSVIEALYKKRDIAFIQLIKNEAAQKVHFVCLCENNIIQKVFDLP